MDRVTMLKRGQLESDPPERVGISDKEDIFLSPVADMVSVVIELGTRCAGSSVLHVSSSRW